MNFGNKYNVKIIEGPDDIIGTGMHYPGYLEIQIDFDVDNVTKTMLKNRGTDTLILSVYDKITNKELGILELTLTYGYSTGD